MQFQRQTDDYLIKKNQQVTQERLKEISDVVAKYAKDNSFDLIIDKKSLPFFSQALDISDKIIKMIPGAARFDEKALVSVTDYSAKEIESRVFTTDSRRRR